VKFARAGSTCEVSVSIPSSFEASYISSGNVLCDKKYPLQMIKEFRLQVIVFDINIPITKGQAVTVHAHSAKHSGNIIKLEQIISQKTGDVLKKNPMCLKKSNVANIIVRSNDKMCLELFRNFRTFGRVTLRDSGKTIAAGIITDILK
jgi:elongation factor 1 alpha-like protein